MKRKIIVLTLVLCVVLQALTFTVGAATQAKVHTVSASSDIMDDLSSLLFDGKKFNKADFPAQSNDKYFRVIRFLETGFDGKAFKDDAGIFVFVYNPSMQHIVKDSKQNRISMMIGTKEQNSGYVKYDLIYCDSSTDNRFLKYKINIDVADLRKYLSSNSREYQVSEIELYRTGLNAKSYKVGGSYRYSGTGEDLYCASTDVYVLELNVTGTYYRPDVISSGGVNHRNELSSVYFSIPNSALREFGKLYSVQGEYYENRIVSIVTEHEEYAEIMEPLQGTKVEDLDGYEDSSDSNEGYSKKFPGAFSPAYNVIGSFPMSASYHSYGLNTNGLLVNRWSNFDTYLNTIPYIFYLEEIELDKREISAEELKNRVNDVGLITLSGTENNVKTSYDLSVKDGYILKSYASTHSDFQTFLAKLDTWFRKDLSSDVFIDSALVPIDVSEFRKMSKEVASDYYFVDKSDITDFRAKCYSADLRDETVFLLRFDQSEVVTCKMDIDIDNDGLSVNDKSDTYLFEQNYYKDFDVLSLTFQDEHGEFVVVPASSDPIDIVGDIVLTDDVPDLIDGLKDAWKWIVAIFLIVLLLIVLILIFQPYLNSAMMSLQRKTEAWWRKFKNSLKPKKQRPQKRKRKYSRSKKE